MRHSRFHAAMFFEKPGVISMLFRLILVAVTVACSATAQAEVWPRSGEDADKDGVLDQTESELASKHRLILRGNRQKSYRPVPIAQVFPGLVLERWDGKKWVKRFNGGDSSFKDLVKYVQDNPTDESWKAWSSKFNWENGNLKDFQKLPEHPQPDLFWRVTPLRTEGEVHELSLQYYWFCTFSDADAAINISDHDGDWEGVDLTVRVSGVDTNGAKVADVIIHNHDRELFPRVDQCTWSGDRLALYAEDNANEPWGIPGDSSHMPRDLKTNKGIFHVKFPGIATSPRPHWGEIVDSNHHPVAGYEINAWTLHPLGEKGSPGTTSEAQAVMLFRGGWGKRFGDGVGLPLSPMMQLRMWDRKFASPE
jgi:hypothetical protein